MLLLPQSSRPPADVLPLTELPNATSICPVAALATEFNELVRIFAKESAKPKRVRKSFLTNIENRLDHIEDEASLLSPRSAEGAAFQIMLATFLNDPARHGPHAINEDYANNMSRRLLTQALKFFGSASHDFPQAREYLLGIATPEKH